MGIRERSWEATVSISKEIIKPWYKKPEYWIGIVANMIALSALIVSVIALQH